MPSGLAWRVSEKWLGAVRCGPRNLIRRGYLRDAQRGGAVHEQAQAVARGGDKVREAGGQLPGDGGHRRLDDLVVLVNR